MKTNSPWRSAFVPALKQYLERWGWDISHIKNGDTEIFIGIDRHDR